MSLPGITHLFRSTNGGYVFNNIHSIQGEVRGAPGSTKRFTAFYDKMVSMGFSKRPILLGQSRGGLMMLAWAMRHPENVKAFVGIYPVCKPLTPGPPTHGHAESNFLSVNLLNSKVI